MKVVRDGKDDRTIAFYNTEAEAYTSRGEPPSAEQLDRFLARLPPGGRVLELGCGGGRDSLYMLERGFAVRPTDGTPEIARAAQARLGVAVDVLLFGDLDEERAYDGVWANACLLHVPRPELGGIIGRIHGALRGGGVFYASYKAGIAEGRDGFDRYYNYPSAEWLDSVYRSFDWQNIEISAGTGSGYDRKPTDWLRVLAVSG